MTNKMEAMIDRQMELLIPYDVFVDNKELKRTRIGSKNDGGYIIIDGFEYDGLYSYGIGDNADFDYDFSKLYPKIHSHLYDFTITELPIEIKNSTFHRQGIFPFKNKNGDTLVNHILENKDNDKKNMFLKMDVEGAEWDSVLAIPDSTLIQFKQIVIEFHGLGPTRQREYGSTQEKRTSLLEKLNKYFCIVHVHFCNGGGFDRIGCYRTPEILEVTYLRRETNFTFMLTTQVFPTILDAPDKPNGTNPKLDFYPFAMKTYDYVGVGDSSSEVKNIVVGPYKSVPLFEVVPTPQYEDKFSITVTESDEKYKYNVTIARTDSKCGWGQNLFLHKTNKESFLIKHKASSDIKSTDVKLVDLKSDETKMISLNLEEKTKLHSIDHIYIIHLKSNTDRKEYLDKWFVENNIPTEYVTYISHTQADTLTDDMIKSYYMNDEKEYIKRGKYTDLEFNNYRKLSNVEISNAIDHIYAMQQSIINNYNTVLIIEDDVIFQENFILDFNKCMKTVPNDFDILTISDGCKLHIDNPRYGINIESNKYWYLNPKHHLRCASTYIIKNSTIKKLLKNIIPFCMTIDWEFNYNFAINNFNVYWLEPTLCSEGSQIGVYKSGLR